MLPIDDVIIVCVMLTSTTPDCALAARGNREATEARHTRAVVCTNANHSNQRRIVVNSYNYIVTGPSNIPIHIHESVH